MTPLNGNDPQLQEREKFVLAFNDTMLKIWREQMTLLGVIDTGRLLHSPKSLPVRADGRFIELGLSQTFLEYGLWQNYGTGFERAVLSKNIHELLSIVLFHGSNDPIRQVDCPDVVEKRIRRILVFGFIASRHPFVNSENDGVVFLHLNLVIDVKPVPTEFVKTIQQHEKPLVGALLQCECSGKYWSAAPIRI